MKVKHLNEDIGSGVGGFDLREPSATEYGKALQQAHNRLQDRYFPFEIIDTYWNPSSANSDGYLIEAEYGRGDYVSFVVRKSGGAFSSEYKLYGPFGGPDDYICEYPTNRKDWVTFVNSAEGKSGKYLLGTFKSLDNIMTTIFSDYGDFID